MSRSRQPFRAKNGKLGAGLYRPPCMLFVKFIVILLLIFIMISLFSGLFFLVKDKGQTKRLVNALTIRIGLSVFAFVLLMAAGFTGLITPHGF